MCFASKVKVSNVDPNAVKAPEPNPLLDKPEAIKMGGSDEEDDYGRKTIKVNKSPVGNKIKASFRPKK